MSVIPDLSDLFTNEIEDIFNETKLIEILLKYYVNILDLGYDESFGFSTLDFIHYISVFDEIMESCIGYKEFIPINCFITSKPLNSKFRKYIIAFKNKSNERRAIYLKYKHEYDYSEQIMLNIQKSYRDLTCKINEAKINHMIQVAENLRVELNEFRNS